MLTKAKADVESVQWDRAVIEATGGGGAAPHAHGFLRKEPEKQVATVTLERGGSPTVTSKIEGLVVLKTTQSGFKDFHRDRYTLLPDCDERCMATELSASWDYNAPVGDYAAARTGVRREICRGFFGPPHAGVFSESLQETIYDAGCLALAAVPEVQSIEIDTPNLHYLPAKLLDAVGDKFEDDVFIPTRGARVVRVFGMRVLGARSGRAIEDPVEIFSAKFGGPSRRRGYFVEAGPRRRRGCHVDSPRPSR